MKRNVLLVLNDAMQHDHEKRPCEMYRELVCSACPSPKPCNDVDVIMCGLAFLIGVVLERKGGE